MTQTSPKNLPPNDEPEGFFASVWKAYREDRKRHKGIIKGTISQQKAMASSERQQEFFREAKETIERVRNLKVQPTRVETFEAAVRRLGLSQEQLREQCERHKRVHLTLYVLGSSLLVYAFWLLLNVGLIQAFGVLVASGAAFVNGYLHGYRAWQIENRNFIRLQDALRVLGTYLVL